jgi:K+-sensing histidine kinase KdpD
MREPANTPTETSSSVTALAFHLIQSLAAMAGIGIITRIGYTIVPVNATTIGFAYLLFVLAVASVWGFSEAAVSSVLATLLFNFFYLDPRLTFSITDPQNWVALFSFLATALVASPDKEPSMRSKSSRISSAFMHSAAPFCWLTAANRCQNN